MNNINASSNPLLLAKFQDKPVSADLSADLKTKNQKLSVSADLASVAKPAALPLPTESLEDLFRQFDGDANGVVSKSELMRGLQSIGFSEEGSEAVAKMVLSEENDINGDGLSLAELQRMQKIASKDATGFDVADLDGSGDVTEKELEQAIALYTKLGHKFDAEQARSVFAAGDVDKNGKLTLAEFADAGRVVPADKPLIGRPIAEKPIDFSASLEDIFKQVDMDGNGKVSVEELRTKLAATGQSDIAGVLEKALFNGTIDVNEDGGISLAEAERWMRIGGSGESPGAVFEMADLDGDGVITGKEFDMASELYQRAGATFDPKMARSAFDDMDMDKNGTLTRAEFDDAGKPKPAPIDFAAPMKDLFQLFDANGDGRVSRAELIATMQARGYSDDMTKSIENFVFNGTTDVNGDDAVSMAELLRREKIDSKDVTAFDLADLDFDGQVSAKELEGAIDLYLRAGYKVDADGVRKVFAGLDADKDSVLSRAEFDGNSDVPVADKPLRAAKVASGQSDAVAEFKITLDSTKGLSPFVLNAQLSALLNDKA